MVRVGCCGFSEAQAKYYEHFRLVEVQQTFYHPPRVETVRRWRDEAPEDFVFTLKAWQLITHEPSSPTYRRLGKEIPESRRGCYGSFRTTPEVLDAWEKTRQIALALRAPAVVFQCPASFELAATNLDRMRKFFATIDRGGPELVWEPRGGWDPGEVGNLCRELDLIHGVDRFRARPATGDPVYFRLHGIGGYRYDYSEGELRELRERCRSREGYVLFNNDAMSKNARRFAELLG